MAQLPKVVIVGGGYAGSAAAVALDDGKHDVILVTPAEVMNHKIGGLRASVLEGDAWINRVLIPYSGLMKKGGKVVQSKATKVKFSDTEKTVELANGETLPFDYLILATGVLSHKTPGSTSTATGLADMKQVFVRRRDILRAAENILVAGGGPTAIEFAGEILEAWPDKKVTLVSSGALMSNPIVDFKPKFAAALASKLQAKHCTVHVDAGRVEFDPAQVDDLGFIIGKHTYKWSTGSAEVDLLIAAVGAPEPSPLLADSGLTEWIDDKGRVKVNRTFEVIGTNGKVFAIGDCNDLAVPKTGYLAGAAGSSVAGNIANAIKGKPLKEIAPAAKALAVVPVGASGGEGQLGPICVGDFVTKMMKGKDLFVGKFWASMGAGTPPAP